VLGFYVSSHPLARHEAQIRAFGNATIGRLASLEDQTSVTVGGLIAGVRLRTDKNEKRYAQLLFEDMEGAVNVMVFNKTYERVRDTLAEDRIVFVRGRVDRRQNEPGIIADDVTPVERAEELLTRQAVICLDAAGLEAAKLEELKELLKAHRGEVPLQFRLRTHNRCLVELRAGREFGVRPSRHLVEDVTRLLGEGHLVYSGA